MPNEIRKYEKSAEKMCENICATLNQFKSDAEASNSTQVKCNQGHKDIGKNAAQGIE